MKNTKVEENFINMLKYIFSIVVFKVEIKVFQK